MRYAFLLPGFLAVLFAACDQRQAELLKIREEFQRQLDAKDRKIDDLTHQLAARNGAVDTQALAQEVAARVKEDTHAEFTELRNELRGGAGEASGAAKGTPAGGPKGHDPNRKPIRFDNF